MRVNPEQSRIIQGFLFDNGAAWYSDSKHISNTERKCLIFSDGDLTWSDTKSGNLTFEQFKLLYMTESKELKITPDKVLSAAKKCPQAEAVLKEMFPEVFEEDKSVDVSKLGKSILDVRNGFEYMSKAFWLDDSYSWEIKRDSNNMLVLIPAKKD